ncbi:MAG: 6-phosphogluconolactonase [Anaerolineae bacterium]|nr:6-phosphogluconolactonase [Anaerolineae bacterium]
MREWTADKIHVAVYENAESLGAAAAAFVIETINAAINTSGSARVIFATGNSQLEFLRQLIAQSDAVDWSRVTAFHLDEYIGLPETHPASFRRYLREKLFDRLPFAAVHLLDGEAADPQAECDRYAALLDAAPIDLACIGIGENAHLAFNDPPADFNTPARVHVVTLDEACRRQQVG